MRVNAERTAVSSNLHAARELLAQAEATGAILIEGGEKDLQEIEYMEGIETDAAVAPIATGLSNGLTNGHTVKVIKKRKTIMTRSAKVRDSGFVDGSDEVEAEEPIFA